MNSLRAVKLFFVTRSPKGRIDKLDGNGSLNISETSEDSLEAGFGESKKFRKPGLDRSIAEYARERKTSLADWSSAQPRSVWASIISAITGLVIILFVFSLFFDCWPPAKKKHR